MEPTKLNLCINLFVSVPCNHDNSFELQFNLSQQHVVNGKNNVSFSFVSQACEKIMEG
uniref:Uncharacterized protein n=1 Tax=Rhizophora mucronata TaxID=61149 RepID=A0A2P2NYR4_RHIMU